MGGFDITLPNAQDYDLWLKMANKMRLVIIPLVLGGISSKVIVSLVDHIIKEFGLKLE